MKKFNYQFSVIFLAFSMLIGMVSLSAVAAPGDVTAKAITVHGIAGENKAGNSETEVFILFDGSWPGEGWEPISIGIIPASTALNIGEINSAFIYLEHQTYILGSNKSDLFIYGVDMSSYWETIPPGSYRVAVFAIPSSGGYENEELFYSENPFEVVEGAGYLYDMSGTTVTVTEGGELDTPTQLTLHLDFGLTGTDTAEIQTYDHIYLDLANFTTMTVPVDFTNAVLTSPAGFDFVDFSPIQGTPLSMVCIASSYAYNVTPSGINIVIDAAIPLEEIATVIVKVLREPDPPDTFSALGHWDGEIYFNTERFISMAVEDLDYEDGICSFNLNFTNNRDESFSNLYTIVAIYDDNRLTGMTTQTITILPTGKILPISIPAVTVVTKVKFMIWSDLYDMIPSTAAFEEDID